MLGITAKKEDSYLSEIVELSGDESMLRTGHGHHFLAKLPQKPAPWLVGTPEGQRIAKLADQLIPLAKDVASSGSVCTLRVRIRHRFVDEVAQLRFHGEKPNTSWTSPLGTSKGWFAPYFHATNRCPYIPRLKEPLLVLFDGPSLDREGDYALAVRYSSLLNFPRVYHNLPFVSIRPISSTRLLGCSISAKASQNQIPTQQIP